MAALVAQNAAVVASIPPLAPITEPIDPEPLISALRTEALRAIGQVAAFSEETRTIANEALAKVQETPPPHPSERILSVFRALARILAVRLLLFIALIGGFSLTTMAMFQQSWISLAIVACFFGMTVGPLAWMEIAGRTKTDRIE